MANKLLVLCPHCGGTVDLDLAWNDMDGRRFVELLMGLPPTVTPPFYRYLKLFKPPNQALRWSRILAIAEELTPMIKAAEIRRNKISYRVPASEWVAALTYLVETPPATLTRPLKSNGYLLQILASQAEKAQAAEVEKKANARQAEKDYATRAVDAAKQSQAKHDAANNPPPIDPEWKKTVMGLLSTARNAPALTPEQKAQQRQQLEEMKARLSPEEKAQLEQLRKPNF